MGQKVHPYIFRVMNGQTWKSNWFANKKDYARLLAQDIIIKKFIYSRLKNAGIADVMVERYAGQTVVKIFTAKPGVVIGKDGAAVDALKDILKTKLQTRDIELKVEEVRKPELVAALIAASIAQQIERRIPYRRAAKQAIDKALESGALGCKIKVGGRLNGVDIARKETYIKGSIPLHTIRSNIDYASCPAHTTYGAIGVKVWLNNGEF